MGADMSVPTSLQPDFDALPAEQRERAVDNGLPCRRGAPLQLAKRDVVAMAE